MKRELTLNVDGEEITLTAVRNGENIVVERDGKEFSVKILAESVVGVQAASSQPTGSVQISSAAGGGGPRPSSGPRVPVTSPAPASGAGAVLSPMTGVVDQVLVTEGVSVAEGDKVVILEAMKMYIDVMAISSGSVTVVSVKPGDSVKEGQPLLTIG